MRELAIVHGRWIAVGTVVLAALVGATLQIAARWLRDRRRWSARLSARGMAARATIEAGATGWLTGVIRVEGTPCASFDGTPCAVATLAASPGRESDLHALSRSASRLVLAIESRRIVLRGPIEVVTSGRRVRSRRAIAQQLGASDEAPFSTFATESRIVRDGERVRVAGVIRRRADEGAGYRDAADTLSLEGLGGPALIAGRQRVLPVGGASLAALLVSMAVIVAGQLSWMSIELVSPLSRHDAVQALRPAERLLLVPAHDHGARAAEMRSSGDPEGALREASLGSDVDSLHERLVALRSLGRRDELAPTWLRLVAAIDARCRKTGRCVHRARLLDMTSTPDRWGAATEDRAPIALLLSHRSAWEHGETTLAFGRALWDLEPKSVVLADLRVAWLLELAGLLIVTGEHEGAVRAMERARTALEDPRIAPTTGERYARDIDHLSTLLYLRGGRVPWPYRGYHENGYCPLREPVVLASHRTGQYRPTRWRSLPIEFVRHLEHARGSGHVPAEMLETEEGPATGFEYAFWFVGLLGAESFGELAHLLGRAECLPVRTIEDLARETSRSRALSDLHAVAALDHIFQYRPWGRAVGELDLESAAQRSEECARRSRSLVAGPWSEPGPGAHASLTPGSGL